MAGNSAIFKKANKLMREGYPRSQAFKIAYQESGEPKRAVRKNPMMPRRITTESEPVFNYEVRGGKKGTKAHKRLVGRTRTLAEARQLNEDRLGGRGAVYELAKKNPAGYPNIEKSGFHKGQYVGYGGGQVWRITKSTSSYGNWLALPQGNSNERIYAFGLAEMSKKLSALGIKKNPIRPIKRKTRATTMAKAKSYVRRPSQASGKAPKKRLIARRTKNLRVPVGLFPNPRRVKTITAKYRVEYQNKNGWQSLGGFATLAVAKEYAVAYAKAKNRPVRVMS